MYHPDPEFLKLAIWPNSGVKADCQEFQTRLMLVTCRKGIQNVYASQYKAFRNWCLEREIDPFE